MIVQSDYSISSEFRYDDALLGPTIVRRPIPKDENFLECQIIPSTGIIIHHTISTQRLHHIVTITKFASFFKLYSSRPVVMMIFASVVYKSWGCSLTYSLKGRRLSCCSPNIYRSVPLRRSGWIKKLTERAQSFHCDLHIFTFKRPKFKLGTFWRRTTRITSEYVFLKWNKERNTQFLVKKRDGIIYMMAESTVCAINNSNLKRPSSLSY